MSSELLQNCGDLALEYSYKVMQAYAMDINPECIVAPPSVALETGCSEDDMIEFLDCETRLDHFSFRPISIIGFVKLQKALKARGRKLIAQLRGRDSFDGYDILLFFDSFNLLS